MRFSRIAIAISFACAAIALAVAGLLGSSTGLTLAAVASGSLFIGYLFGSPGPRDHEHVDPSRMETADAVPVVPDPQPPVPAEDAAGEWVAFGAPASEPEPAPGEPPLPATRIPADIECPSVLQALVETAEEIDHPVAAHLWLEDPASATLRLVDAVGPMTPDPTPVPADDGILAEAVRSGTAQLDVAATVSDRLGEASLWRFAVPLKVSGAAGVVALDFRTDARPDAIALAAATGGLRGALAGCLALHIARTETEAARMLLDLARDLSRVLDRDEVVSLALARAMALSGAATGSVMLIDRDSGAMRIAEARGLPIEVVQETQVAEGEGIAGWVLATGQPLLIEDLPKHGGGSRRHGVRSAVSVPIGDEDGLLGVLNVGSRQFPARFTNTHLRAVETIGKQAAVALRNATALESMRDVYFETLRALAIAMETKDPYAVGGTQRVTEYALAVGREMGLGESEEQALELACMLHDIGMSAAGESVATAARPLSTVERGLLKMHPAIAAQILEQAPALRTVVPIVYHHHEWFDGHGYVGGLSGEAIPLGARILAVADSYVAMTSDRPYRRAMTAAEAMRELREKAGTQFDPDVVAVFEQMYGERRGSRDQNRP